MWSSPSRTVAPVRSTLAVRTTRADDPFRPPAPKPSRRGGQELSLGQAARSKRSASITLVHAFTKSFTKDACASAEA